MTRLPIMSFEEYSRLRHSIPYTYEITGAQSSLFYFGVRHTHDITDPILGLMRGAHEKFKPDIVIVEGYAIFHPSIPSEQRARYRRRIATTPYDQLINESGEAGAAIVLAEQLQNPIISPEPPLSLEIKHLQAQGFAQDHIFAFYIFRQIHCWATIPKRSTLETYLEPYIEMFKNACEWNEFDFSIATVEKVGFSLWGLPLQQEDASHFYGPRVAPIVSHDMNSVINEVCRQSSYFRDTYIVEQISLLTEQFKRIFIVYGATHAVVQEQALRRIFN